MHTTEQNERLPENLLGLVSRVREVQIGHENLGEKASSKYRVVALCGWFYEAECITWPLCAVGGIVFFLCNSHVK